VPISWNIYNHKYPNKTSGIKGEASVKVLNICVFTVLFALVREARRTTLTWSVIAFLLNRSEPVTVNTCWTYRLSMIKSNMRVSPRRYF
jgi:hypothetical protein